MQLPLSPDQPGALRPPHVAWICALLGVVVSLPILRNGFAIDDFYLVVNNHEIRHFASLPGLFLHKWSAGPFNQGLFRPLTAVLYSLEYHLFGAHPAPYHLISALLHGVCCALVARLILLLTAAPLPALVGGALFALHPVHTEAIAAVTYQTTLLAAALALTALLAFHRVLRDGATPASLLRLFVPALLGPLAKEDAFVVPLLCAAWTLTLRPPGWWRAGLRAAPVLLAAVLLPFFLRRHATLPIDLTFFESAPRRQVFLTMISVAWLYARLLLLPGPLCPFYDWYVVPIQQHLSAPVVLGFVSLAALGLGWALALRRARVVALGLGLVPLSLVHVMHFVPILIVAAERFLYLPSAALALAAGPVLAALCQGPQRLDPGRWGGPSRRVYATALGLLLLTYAGRTLLRWPDWHDDVRLNLATARNFPQTPIPGTNLVQVYQERRDPVALQTGRRILSRFTLVRSP